jgi:hypothetical protein
MEEQGWPLMGKSGNMRTVFNVPQVNECLEKTTLKWMERL